MTRDPIAALCTENVQPRSGRRGWHGGATPVGALRGVTPDAAVWSPAPGRKSIWELMLHIAYWKYAVRRRLDKAGVSSAESMGDERFAVAPSNWPHVPAVPDQRAWAAHVALLRREHERLVQVIAGIPSRRYGTVLPGRRRWTVGELIVGIAQHDAYHTGQIQLLKRLWQSGGVRRGR